MDILQTKNSKSEKCWYHELCKLDYNCDACPRYHEVKYMMENSNLPKSKQKAITLFAPDCDREAYKKLAEIKSNIYDFVREGKSLYIGSKYTGNAKTSWSVKLMHKYFDEVWDNNGFKERALFIHVPTFLMRCKDFSNQDDNFNHVKNLAMDIDLVVWDDIASTDMSSYDFSQILPYIDHRCFSELSNIYTGNFDNKDDLSNKLGERLASRIWSKNTEIVIFNSKDLR